jgi:hypothetical protein
VNVQRLIEVGSESEIENKEQNSEEEGRKHEGLSGDGSHAVLQSNQSSARDCEREDPSERHVSVSWQKTRGHMKLFALIG